MPWTETCIMEQRMMFVLACKRGDASVAELCRQYSISRKTGYKWLNRYDLEGVEGLKDRSRAPLHCPHRLSSDAEDKVRQLRVAHMTFGPKKLRARLARLYPDLPLPAASTIGDFLARAGLVRRRRRRQRTPPHSRPFVACANANDVWCADFKGWFRTGDGRRCEAFTLMDAATRYVLCIQVVPRIDVDHIWPLFDAAFRQFGRPQAVRTDNGPPFASTGAGGLSPLAVRLVKAGVMQERIEPGCPEQNGRHERMHLTLQEDTASPPAPTLTGQQRRFNRFVDTYNDERPHEALDMATPASLYVPSSRTWSGRLTSPDYDPDTAVRRVRNNGEIKWRGRSIYLSQTLAGEPVGLNQIDDAVWRVTFGPVLLGHIDNKGRFCKPKRKRKSRRRGHVDNAAALTTCPPRQQQEQK